MPDKYVSSALPQSVGTPDRDLTHIDDWVAETPQSIAARLEGAKATQSQIRLTIGVMAVISMMMLIACYNAYLSYDYEWVLAQTNRTLSDAVPADVLTVQALKDWASSRNVTVSLLGVHASVDEAAVLGSSVLFIISLWLLLLARRENHTVGSLLRDTDTPRPGGNGEAPAGHDGHIYSSGQRWLIFHSILANSLFVTCDHSLSSVRSLDAPGRPASRNGGGFKGRLNRAAFGVARGFFFFFPVVASLAVFLIDRWSYRIPDPFEPLAPAPGHGLPFYRASMVVFIVCWVLLTLCCLQSSRYSSDTEKVLGEYKAKLGADLSR